MSSVKISEKETLDKLAAHILLQTGKKLTQQELLSICVNYSMDNIEDLVSKITIENRIWSDEEINSLKEDYTYDFGLGSEKLSEEVDSFLYGKDEE